MQLTAHTFRGDGAVNGCRFGGRYESFSAASVKQFAMARRALAFSLELTKGIHKLANCAESIARRRGGGGRGRRDGDGDGYGFAFRPASD